ncbi:MAG: cupredoxin domain-containing protein [Sphingomicrobium sp.]
MRYAFLLMLPLATLAASSVPAEAPAVVSVQLSNFKFTPTAIVLDHGRHYVLRLVNVASGSHDFTAPSFFAAANVAPADRRLVAEGEVEVPAGQTREISLTAPAAGRYKLKCSHSFHKMFGMSGTIVVR